MGKSDSRRKLNCRPFMPKLVRVLDSFLQSLTNCYSEQTLQMSKWLAIDFLGSLEMRNVVIYHSQLSHRWTLTGWLWMQNNPVNPKNLPTLNFVSGMNPNLTEILRKPIGLTVMYPCGLVGPLNISSWDLSVYFGMVLCLGWSNTRY